MLTSASMNLVVGPAAWTMARMAAMILALQICYNVWSCLVEAMGVLPVAPFWRRYFTQGHRAATVQPWGCPVLPCPTGFTLTLFFWVVKRRLKIGSCACARTGRVRVERLPPEEELDVLEAERVVNCVSSSLEIFSHPEEE